VWRVLDPTHGRFYYYNRATGETSWSPPPGVSDSPAPASQSPARGNGNTYAAPGYQSAGQNGYGGNMGGNQQNDYNNRGPANGYGRDDRNKSPGYGGKGNNDYNRAPVQVDNTPMGPQKSLKTGGAEVTVRGCRVTPWETFEECSFPPQLQNALSNAGFPNPSPIQAYSWPIITEGRDLVGVAKTGSGKTLGFLLPAFKVMLQQRLDPYRAGGPLLLTLAPTRELACQIEVESQKFGNPAGLRSACAYGGAPKGPQLGQLRRGAHVLIATPGRLNDFLKMGAVRLRSVMYLVLDEADRMLDMGFEPQIRSIIAEIPQNRQTMMFTATWPREVRRLAEDFLREPAQVQIGNSDALQANADIDQKVMIVNSQWEKQDKIVEVLQSQVQHGDRVLIFTSTKRMCDQLARTLESRNRIPCVSIHGDREQRERDAALQAFKTGRSPVMVATDVAARGLDIKGVKMVVNFDPANNAEDYVHRIGRTGRAGEKGTALTFLTPDEAKQAREIADVMTKTGLRVPDELADLARNARRSGGNSRYGKGGYGGGKGGGKGFRGGGGFGGDRYKPY